MASAPDPWEMVRALLALVIALCSPPSRGRKWLTELEKSDEGRRLGVCLAIDLSSGALDPQTVAEIVNSPRKGGWSAPAAFAKAVERVESNGGDLACISKLPAPP
jgi:hypothetical protein